MEEILASIRRIIADDDASKAPEGAAAEPPPPPRPVQQVQPPPPPVYAAPPPPPPEPVARFEPEPEPEPPLPPMAEEPVAFATETVAEQSADILDLTESMATTPESAVPPPQFRTIDGHSDVGFDDAPEPAPAPFPPAPPRLDDHQERLLSTATTAAVDSAFNALAQTVLSQNARTLEDLVKEMLRPMLKSWLDDNLPGMVERMVRAEIERVSRGRPS
jgi:cell pole-organizing protein PopZ